MAEENRKPSPEGAPERRPDGQGNRPDGQSNRRRRNRNRHRQGQPRPETEGAVTETAAAPERKEGGEQSDPNRRRNRNRNRHRNRHRDPASASVPTEAENKQENGEAPLSEEARPFFSFEETLSEEPQGFEPEPVAPPAPPKPTYEVIGVRFRENGKVYYFDPNGMTCEAGTSVIVETSRGLEFGTVTMGNRMVTISEVVLPLRKLVRFATEVDIRRHEDNLEKETEAYNLCLERIEEHRLEMKLVDVEYAFDNSKLLFYFTSEERVDFRDLVKDLASVFRTRIELRQIGIRDEAKLMGGLGICGRPFCCKSFLPDFVQVSIKMAKEQNLSLNAAKISGACGRLMCCLRYEYDTYVAESALTPKVDALVATPDGDGVVVESLPLKGIVKVVLDQDIHTVRIYHRDDLTVKGHAKGRHKQVGRNAPAPEKKKPEAKSAPDPKKEAKKG